MPLHSRPSLQTMKVQHQRSKDLNPIWIFQKSSTKQHKIREKSQWLLKCPSTKALLTKNVREKTHGSLCRTVASQWLRNIKREHSRLPVILPIRCNRVKVWSQFFWVARRAVLRTKKGKPSTRESFQTWAKQAYHRWKQSIKQPSKSPKIQRTGRALKVLLGSLTTKHHRLAMIIRSKTSCRALQTKL